MSKYLIEIDGKMMDYKQAAVHLEVKESTAMVRFRRYRKGEMSYEVLTTKGPIQRKYYKHRHIGNDEWQAIKNTRTRSIRNRNLDKIKIGTWERRQI